MTNDGWFGITTGPYQHFQQARVQAIEVGLPVARAANTGISAVVDPLGRSSIRCRSGAKACSIRRCRGPSARRSMPAFGDAPVAIMVAIALVAVVRRRLKASMLKV